jgi:hypothetical protein
VFVISGLNCCVAAAATIRHVVSVHCGAFGLLLWRLVRRRVKLDLFGEFLQLVVELVADRQRLLDVSTARYVGGSVASKDLRGLVRYVQNDEHAYVVAQQV